MWMLIRLEVLLLASSWIGDSSSGLSECVHGKWLVLELGFNYRARTSSSSILSAQLREAYVPVVECKVSPVWCPAGHFALVQNVSLDTAVYDVQVLLFSMKSPLSKTDVGMIVWYCSACG